MDLPYKSFFPFSTCLYHWYDTTPLCFAANITLKPSGKFNKNINCPGDVVSYNCSISSPNILHLTWLVTLPGSPTINVTYTRISSRNSPTSHHRSFSSVLSSYIDEQYIESIIMFSVLREIDITGTTVQCTMGTIEASITLTSQTTGT